MANGVNPAIPLHLQLEKPKSLKQTIKLHQKWLTGGDRVGERADLSLCILSGYNLDGVDLTKANLWRSDLSKTSLINANLTEANLMACNLTGANLQKANLHKADLRSTILTDANLSDADCSHSKMEDAFLKNTKFCNANIKYANLKLACFFGSDLVGADLQGANFKSVKFQEAILGNTNFKEAKALDTVEFWSPCTIDHRTLHRSQNLSEKFLRGCGLADTFIDYIPSLFHGSAIQFYSCFISYSSKDKAFVKRLYADLQGAGVRCWFAPEDLKTGDKIRQVIDKSIKIFDKLMIILSEHSLQSDWVENEVEAAMDKEAKNHSIVLFPIRVDEAVMDTDKAWASTIRRSRHIGDFSHWKDHDTYQVAFKRLLKNLKEEAPIKTE